MEQKTSLLVAGPPARGFAKLPFRLMKFDDLFRSEPLKKANMPSLRAYFSALSRKATATSPMKSNPMEQSPTLSGDIYLNKNNERVDLPLKELPGDVQRRLDAMNRKFCNDYHLGGICRDQRGCKYDHRPISSEVKQGLQLRLRKKACKQGVACRKVVCFYGHHCPFPSCTDHASCQFKGMHGVDQKVASCIRPGNPD